MHLADNAPLPTRGKLPSMEKQVQIMAATKRASNRTTITMRDVARLANVSQSTVSRVLSDALRYGDPGRGRVRAAGRSDNGNGPPSAACQAPAWHANHPCLTEMEAYALI